jgi:hypothetical protein
MSNRVPNRGKVKRDRRRRVNSDWSSWMLYSTRPEGHCTDLRHEKFVAAQMAWCQMFGPFEDVKRADCGCRFQMVPVCQDCGEPVGPVQP